MDNLLQTIVADGDGSPSAKQARPNKRRPAGDGSQDEKRTKTGRACDACRSKKIRCDILPSDAVETPICAHCKQYNLECTFFLPITETRFKKRRQADEDVKSPVGDPRASGTRNSSTSSTAVGPGAGTGAAAAARPGSIPFLVHTGMPARPFDQHDLANHSHWLVSQGMDGNFSVRLDEEGMDAGLEKTILPCDVLAGLLDTYFEYLQPMVPIIGKHELLAMEKIHPLLLYGICLITSTRRGYPRHYLVRLRGAYNGLIRANDILSCSRLEHILAIVIVNQCGELNAQPVTGSSSATVMRQAAAVRMAQEMGFHRESKVPARTAEEVAQMELRRRIWAACLLLDRGGTGALGLPLHINIEDCDVLLPAPYRVVPELEPSQWPTDIGHMMLGELVKMTVLHGRIFQLIYGPAGLRRATDDQLEQLLRDLKSWHANIPEPLKFTGRDSSVQAGMLHLTYAAIAFTFWRSFIRVTESPSHLKFTLNSADWNDLVEVSRDVIFWVCAHNDVMDTYFLFPFSTTSAALVQYHTWARRRDPKALDTLRAVKDMVQDWEEVLQPEQMSVRRKTMETMTLLYEAALNTGGRVGSQQTTPGLNTGANTNTNGNGTGANSSNGTQSSTHMSTNTNTPEVNDAAAGLLGIAFGNGQAVQAKGSAQPSTDDWPPFDQGVLDALPEANFDWGAWGQYFDTVDRNYPGSRRS